MFLNHTNTANLTNPANLINLDLTNVTHLTISIPCPSTVPSPEPADLTFTKDDFFSMAKAFLAVFKGVLAALLCAITFSAAFFVLAAVLLLLYQGFVCLWQLIVQKIQNSRSYRHHHMVMYSLSGHCILLHSVLIAYTEAC